MGKAGVGRLLDVGPQGDLGGGHWLGYLLYLHLRAARPKERNVAFAIIVFSFLLLQMCWYGINYLPAAQGVSINILIS